MKQINNKIVLTLLIITVVLSSCNKNEPTNRGTQPTPNANDTITTAAAAGEILVNNYQNFTIQTNSIFSGQTISAWQNNNNNNVEPSVIENGIMYLRTFSGLKAINLSNGAILFQKSYSSIYLNTTSVLNYPVIKDSVLYFVSQGENNELIYLHAYHKLTGAKLFSTKISLGIAITSPMLATPIISGNNLYVTFQQNLGSNKYPSIFCINRHNGTTIWSRTFGYNQIISTFPALYNNTVILSILTGGNSTTTDIVILNALTGATLLQNNYFGVDFVGTEQKFLNNQLYSFSYSSNNINDVSLNTINPTSGSITNKYTIGTLKFYLDSTNLFFVKNGILSNYSLTNNSIIWAKEVACESFRKTQPDSNAILIETTSPLVTDKYIYTMEYAVKSGSQNDLMTSVIIYSKQTGKKLYELKNYSGFSFSRYIIKNESGIYFYQNKRGVSFY